MDDLKEQIKSVQSAFIPIIEESRIRMSFEVGKICFNLMQSLNKNGLMGIDELLELCQDETGLSRNTINNVSLLYSKLVDWEVNGEFFIDEFYKDWIAGTGNQPTLAKVMRAICPKVQPDTREKKVKEIKSKINKSMQDGTFIDVKILKNDKTILALDEAI